MKCKLLSGVAPVAAVFTLLTSFAAASPREVALPAGTLLQCTLNEPNFSSATADIGDPVVCHLRGVNEFGQQAFPRGSYLVGHLESAKEPGHFVGKGSLKLQFDRIGLPSGDLPLEAKMIGTRGYRERTRHPRRCRVDASAALALEGDYPSRKGSAPKAQG
jgi:hypothetical protein